MREKLLSEMLWFVPAVARLRGVRKIALLGSIHWVACGPCIRRSCDALHCGERHYLHDDLEAITLSEETISVIELCMLRGERPRMIW